MSTIQSASALLMVRPATFGYDEETAASNTFQHKPSISKDEVRQRASDEFQSAVDTLRAHGVAVSVFEDKETLPKPDAVFPNNWLSMWQNGSTYLYPMATESRRIERSDAALELLREQYRINEVIDLTSSELSGTYLESTGVMVFDHEAKIAYGCLSVRCDEELFEEHALSLGYTPITFTALDSKAVPIYHTNVLMGVQSTTAVLCLEALPHEDERDEVMGHLKRTGHDVIKISREQMNSFCGNVLEVQNKEGDLFLALSQTAYDAFTPEQRERLSRDKTLLPLAIPTIETIGGGSVRCMLAENFLPSL